MDAKWKTLAKLALSLIAAGVLVAGVAMPIVLGTGLAARNEATRFLDTTCDLKESAPPQKTYVYARDGKTLVATLFSQDRQLVPLSQVPKYLQDALVATEDRRFYSHHGVDIRGLLRSAVSTGSGDTQGGSTLTMQYVKQIRYFQAGNDPAKQDAAIAQNLQRKMEDAKCALYFENTKHESKAQILDNYLNIAFFGENSYGIQTAAQTYFSKPASQLTLAESATLVGLLRAPSAYDPYMNPTAAKARRDEVLQNLVAVHKLSQKEADVQKATPITLAAKTPPKLQQGCANSGSTIPNVAFFCEYARNWLQDVNGIKDLDTGGYKIVTTIDPAIQTSTQSRMQKDVPAAAASTAVLPVLDPHTGDVLAMASSKSFGSGPGQTEQPIFTSATASGASTFKLFPLLTALSTGVPDSYALKTVDNNGVYKPLGCATAEPGAQNGDANVSYNTTETLRSATVKSDNSYFVALAEKVLSCQLQPIVDLMRKLGVSSIDQPTGASGDNGRSYAQVIVAAQRAQQLVLGSVPTSALQLAGAYAAVANNGVFNAPAPILSITDSNGNDVPLKRTRGSRVLAPQVAQQAVDILKGDTQGSGTSAGSLRGPWYSAHAGVIAGKTGTQEASPSNMYPDKNATTWFVGMTPDIVAASGIINFDTPNTPLTGLLDPATGKPMAPGKAYGDFAASVWINALEPTLAAKQGWQWPDPNNIGGIDVPNIAGQSVAAATATLAQSQLKISVLGAADNVACDSNQPPETVGFYGPQRAAPGSTITVCLSTGVSAEPPPPPPPVTRRTTPASPAPGTRPTGGATKTPGPGRGTRSRGPGG